jgi:hypothetical protein
MESIKAGATEEGDSLNNVQTVLQKYNMTLLDTTGTFKPLGDVIDELGTKWSTLDKFQQNQIATAINKTVATHGNMWINYAAIDKIEVMCYN